MCIPLTLSPQTSGHEMFEFKPELVVGDDQEANAESLHCQAGEKAGSDGEEEEEEEEARHY